MCFDEAYELDKRLIPVEVPKQITERLDCIILPLPVTNDGIFINTPLSKKHLEIEKILEKADPSTVIFGGKIEKPFHPLCTDRGLEVIDYLEREELAVLNAVPTAEGALEILMQDCLRRCSVQNAWLPGLGEFQKFWPSI